MYNFSIPSQLKSWIDSIAVAGVTFSYSAEGVMGLCAGKRVIIASARGSVFTAPSPMAALDHQEAYLRGMFGFLGIDQIDIVRAEGVAYGAEPRQQALDGALAEVDALAA
jgi:FMN-dependent NADH-azoreductase